LHIVGLGAWSHALVALGLATVQLIVIAVICPVATAPNGIVFPASVADWASVLYMALFAGAGALIGQTWAQAHLPATRAAIIMSMEPVFAALFAVMFGGESATARMIFGGLLVLSAMLLAELAPRRKVEVEVTHLTV
jgi:drug/metabolite transporter (DMT)-like permease